MNDAEQYFRILRDKRIINPLRSAELVTKIFPFHMTKQAFEAISSFTIAFYDTTTFNDFADFLYTPTLLLTTPIKNLFYEYEPTMEFKAVQLLPKNVKDTAAFKPVYWVPYLEFTDVFHQSATFLGTGGVKECIIDKDKIRNRNIIHMKTPLEDIWLASLPVAECILRHRPLGMVLEKIELR